MSDQLTSNEQVRPLADRLLDACVVGCTCLTKTPDIQHHEPLCHYRLFMESWYALRTAHEPTSVRASNEQLAQALRNLRDVAHREVSPRYSAALDKAFTLADIALGEFDSEGDVSREADVGPGGGVRATHATGSAPSKPGAAEPPSAWQPIETAPTLGKWVLLWWPDVTDVAFVGYCVDGQWRAATSGDRWPTLPGPTHWMPLPSPPVTKSAVCDDCGARGGQHYSKCGNRQFKRGDINPMYCVNCGASYERHIHTDEASLCPDSK